MEIRRKPKAVSIKQKILRQPPKAKSIKKRLCSMSPDRDLSIERIQFQKTKWFNIELMRKAFYVLTTSRAYNFASSQAR